jgi:folylpolyglutamate synthase/dihydropteroate synthase
MAAIIRATVPAASIDVFESIDAAAAAALERCDADDRIVVFGSFLTVGEVMRRGNAKR